MELKERVYIKQVIDECDFEIIGETVKKIPADVKAKNPQVPWKRIAEMRNKLIHEH